MLRGASNEKEFVMAKSNRGFADILAETVGKVITDIRQHVVEEPWFGQTLREFSARVVERGQAVEQETPHHQPEQNDGMSIDV